jgi:hypothetical protein
VYTDSYFNKIYKDIQAFFSRIDTTDAGREQINDSSQEYLRQDLTWEHSIKDIGILINVKVN